VIKACLQTGFFLTSRAVFKSFAASGQLAKPRVTTGEDFAGHDFSGANGCSNNPALDFPRTRGTIHLLLGEKAGMREGDQTNIWWLAASTGQWPTLALPQAVALRKERKIGKIGRFAFGNKHFRI
jgi:hypothetical protein